MSAEGCSPQLDGEVLLPAQLCSRRRIIAGERRLMLAILEDAVDCYRRYATARTTRGRQEFADARAWLDSTDRTWLFSFESICDTLDLDPDGLRRGLAALRERQRDTASRRVGVAA